VADDRSREQRSCAEAKLLNRGVDAHEAAAQTWFDARNHQRRRRNKASGNEHHEDHRGADRDRHRDGRQVGGDEQRHDGNSRYNREHLALAVAVRELADVSGGEHGGEPAEKVQIGQVGFLKADIGHHVWRDKRNHREPREHQREHEYKDAQMIGAPEHRFHLFQRPVGLAFDDMAAHGGENVPGENQNQRRDHYKEQERRAPGEMRSKKQSDRNADDGRQRKSGHDHAGRGASTLFWDRVADDGVYGRTRQAAKCAGNRARGQQRTVARRDARQQRRYHEPRIEEQQRFPAIEAVGVEGHGQRCDRGRKGVRGYQEPELLRRNQHQPHQLRAERHDDHEVQDVGELDGGQH
jgi:hypothetical protein